MIVVTAQVQKQLGFSHVNSCSNLQFLYQMQMNLCIEYLDRWVEYWMWFKSFFYLLLLWAELQQKIPGIHLKWVSSCRNIFVVRVFFFLTFIFREATEDISIKIRIKLYKKAVHVVIVTLFCTYAFVSSFHCRLQFRPCLMSSIRFTMKTLNLTA